MLLLFGLPGKPLHRSTYIALDKALEALGPGNADGPVTVEALRRLGASQADAADICAHLDREEELETLLALLEKKGVFALTRISPEYPRRLRHILRQQAPEVLFCAGNAALFETECVSLVGSRRLRQPGRDFAAAVGRQAARNGRTYVSGGAVGADTVGFDSAMDNGGSTIVFPADSLLGRMETLRRELDTGRVLLASEQGFDLSFSAARAYSRNRLIHAMGKSVFVAQSDYGSGGTWNGVVENLKHGWSHVFMCSDEPGDPGAAGLLERGCTPVGRAELCGLSPEPAQTTLYDN